MQQGVKQSVLSVCLSVCPSVNTKIARSRDLGIWATYKHNKFVKIMEKLTTLCFKSFGKAHERCKRWFLLATPINRTHCWPCAFCLCAQPSITCRSTASRMLLQLSNWCRCSGRGMCSKRSSWLMDSNIYILQSDKVGLYTRKKLPM